MPANLSILEAAFSEALELGPGPEREAYLERACAGDPDQRRQVEALLAVHDRAGRFLEAPTVDHSPGRDDPVGATIGPYKLLERIGEGGMGVVYMAEQTHPVRRTVALKIIKPGMDSRQVVARFEAERQALALMDHPNIAKVLDAGTTDSGLPYFVMELVRGISITDYCDRENLPIAARLELFVLVCRAIQHAHQKGVIHRDIKPSNVLVTLHDGVPVPKVIDFGIAKATGASLTDRTLHTGFAQLVGTPMYMSPEQAELSGLDIDTRSDIYSLGVLLYELLTGTTPFDGEALRKAAFDEMRRIIREDQPPTPSTRLSSLGEAITATSARRSSDPRYLNRSVRGELDWIAMKALEKDRRRRYETANDFAADVMRYLTDRPVEACPPSARYRMRTFARRNRLALTTASVVGLALIVGTAVSLWQALLANRARMQAEEQVAATLAINTFLLKDLLEQADLSSQDPARGNPDPDLKVRTLLDRAARKIDERFADQPVVEALIRQTIGESYRTLGLHAEALPHAMRVIDLRRRVLGAEHSETLVAQWNLAVLYRAQGKLTEAEHLLHPTLEAQLRLLGPDSQQTTSSQDSLASVYAAQGRQSEAEPLYRASWESSRRVLGAEHADTLVSQVNLAKLYIDQGKVAEGEPLLVSGLEAQRRVLGPEHPHTLISQSNLAAFLNARGRPKEAEALERATWEVKRRLHGPGHPDTLGSQNNLAECLLALGKTAEGEALHVSTLELAKQAFGPEHPNTLICQNNLARCYMNQGKLAEAEGLLSTALEAQRRVLGHEHPTTLSVQKNLAMLRWEQGKLAEAEGLLRDILEVRRRALGPEHPSTLLCQASLTELLRVRRKLTEAEPLLLATLKAQRRVLGPEHPHTLACQRNLAMLYRDRGKTSEAETLLRATIEAAERTLGAGHPSSAEFREQLADLLKSKGEAPEGRNHPEAGAKPK